MDIDRRRTDARIVSLASTNGMVVTAHQLRAAGIAPHLIDRRVGWLLNPVSKGIYVVGAITPSVRLRAALVAIPNAAASHRTAAAMLGLPLASTAEITVTAPGRTRRDLEGVTVRGTRWLPADDVTAIDDLRVTSVARTVCDLGSDLAFARLRHLVESLIAGGRLDPGDLQACALGYRRRGRAGSGVVGRLDLEVLASEPLPCSALERRAVQLLREHHIEGWVIQYRPPWYDGLRGVVDLAWPDLRIVMELDGRRWHATTQAQAEDRRRDRAAVVHGWVTLRFGWQEVVRRPGAVAQECQAVIEARRSSSRQAG